jgi:hypothetical protein
VGTPCSHLQSFCATRVSRGELEESTTREEQLLISFM